MTQAMNRPSEAMKLPTAIAQTETSESLDEAIVQALDEARTACQTTGDNSSECAVAWDIVEELQAERSHRHTKQKSAFELYCIEHPEAIEALIYDV
jgi:hypothetical protein